jgi:hypothetical protein
MSSILQAVVEEIAKLIVIEILARLLLWSGESLLFAISFGHRKPRWKGYRGKGAIRWVFSEMVVILLGASFWVCLIKLGIGILRGHRQAQFIIAWR